MATRTGTVLKTDDGWVVATWQGLAGDGDDVGTMLSLGKVHGLCAQAVGPFGNDGSVTVQGSNDGTNWAAVHDHAGNAVTFTAAGLKDIVERPRFLRPAQTEGEPAVTNISIIIAGERR